MTRSRKMHQRHVGKKNLRPLCLIFCEGERTEPCYFGGFATAINGDPDSRKKIRVDVQPVGEGTTKIIEAAEAYVKREHIENAQVWCVYDKDDFKNESFNSVAQRASQLNKEQKAQRVTYHVAWSNVCVEYWFVLHFRPYTVDNGGDDYIRVLDEEFKKLGRGKYQKTDPKLFDILTEQGDPKQAIRRAKARREECPIQSPAKCCPATTVDKLVEELAKYLPKELKQRYL